MMGDGVGRIIRRLERDLDVPVSYVRSRVALSRHRAAFDEPCVYLSFIGYPRSGHSLMGQLLNAHHNVVVANEVNVFNLLRRPGPLARADPHLDPGAGRGVHERGARKLEGYQYVVGRPVAGAL